MLIRHKDTKVETYSDKFNTSTIGEVVTQDDSLFIKDLDVFIRSKNKWKDMRQAFADKDIITDNFNINFREPKSEEEYKQGYY